MSSLVCPTIGRKIHNVCHGQNAARWTLSENIFSPNSSGTVPKAWTTRDEEPEFRRWDLPGKMQFIRFDKKNKLSVMYEFALVISFYCCVYCDPNKSDFLISLLIFCFEPSAQEDAAIHTSWLNWKPVSPKRGDHRLFFWNYGQKQQVQCGIWSAHTWWMVTFLPRLQREWLDTFPLKPQQCWYKTRLLFWKRYWWILLFFLLGVHSYHNSNRTTWLT